MSGLNDRYWKANAVIQDGMTIDPSNWTAPTPEELKTIDDVLKMSGKHDVTVQDLDIPASLTEDSVDAVRGTNYRFFRDVIRGSITLKGEIVGWLFRDSKVYGTIEVGQFDNYWYPGRGPTRAGMIDTCTNPLGGPIKLILWDAEMPLVMQADVLVVRRPKWLWFPYFLSQYIWVRLVNLTLPADKKHLTK